MAYNALESIQAFQVGQGQRKERERERTMQGVGNALAGGNYAGGAGLMFNMGDIEGGMKLQQYGKSLEDAEAEKKRQGLMRYGMGLLQTPMEQREAMRPQIAQTLAQIGVELPPDQLQSMDLSDAAIQATLQSLQDPETLMAQYQKEQEPYTLGPDQVRMRGSQEIARGPEKPQEPVKYASATDSLGVRRYTEGPNIGQPVPGFETPRPERGGMEFSVDENGNPVVRFGGPGQGSAFGSAGDRTGAAAFGAALGDAGTADATAALANQARSIIQGGYNSGALANIKGQAGRVLNEFGIGNPEDTADFEQFTAVNNQLAAQMLKLFGGSDTERELAISMASNIGPSFGEPTNIRMLDALDQAIAIQRRKPEFQAQWIQKNGSLDAIDQETQLGYQATWDRFLQSQFSNLQGAASDANQAAVEEAAQGLSPDKMRRLQELRAKRDRGELQ